MILAIETSSSVCSVALFDGKKTIEKNVSEINRHSENLALFVSEILQENKISISTIQGILVSGGPGSFTGLRIGMSFAKGFAIPNKIPIALINSMENFISYFENDLQDYERPICIFKSHREMVFVLDIKSNKVNDINYLNVNEIENHFPGCDCVLTNDETIYTGNLNRITEPLRASMLIHYFRSLRAVVLKSDYESLKLYYGMEYKAKLWKD